MKKRIRKEVILVIAIILIQILMSAAVLISKATENDNIDVVEFKATWPNKEETLETKSGVNVNIPFEITLKSGIPIHDVTLEVIEEITQTSPKATLLNIIDGEGTHSYLKEYGTLAGQAFSGSVRVNFAGHEKTGNFNEYQKNITLRLSGNYINPYTNNTENIIQEVDLKAEITPADFTNSFYGSSEINMNAGTNGSAFSRYLDEYDQINSRSKVGYYDGVIEYLYTNSITNFKVSEFTQKYTINLSTINASWEKLNFKISRTPGEDTTSLSQLNTDSNLVLDATMFTNAGYNVERINGEDGVTTLEITRGEDVEQYNNTTLYTEEKSFYIYATFKIIEPTEGDLQSTTVNAVLSTNVSGFNITEGINGEKYTKDSRFYRKGIENNINIFSAATDEGIDYDLWYEGIEKNDYQLAEEIENGKIKISFETKGEAVWNGDAEQFEQSNLYVYSYRENETPYLEYKTTDGLEKIMLDNGEMIVNKIEVTNMRPFSKIDFYKKGDAEGVDEPFFTATQDNRSYTAPVGTIITDYYAKTSNLTGKMRNVFSYESVLNIKTDWDLVVNKLEEKITEQEIENIDINSITRYQNGEYIDDGPYIRCDNSKSATVYIKHQKENQLSYMELDIGNYNLSLDDVGIPKNNTIINLKMTNNQQVIKNKEKYVINKNPVIYVQFPDNITYAFSMNNIKLNNGNNQIEIKETKFDRETNILKIVCEGTYDSSKMADVTITIRNFARMLNSNATIGGYNINAWMVTDNENYVFENAAPSELLEEGVPSRIFRTSKYYSITGHSKTLVKSGVYEEDKRVHLFLESNNIWGELGKGFPKFIEEDSPVKYYTLLESSQKIKNIKIVSKLPVEGNKSVISMDADNTQDDLIENTYNTETGKWEGNYVLPNDTTPENFNLPEEGSLVDGDVIPEISLTNLNNIKVKLLRNGLEYGEIPSSNYTIFYSNDISAEFDLSKYTEYEEGVTDVINAKAIQVVFNETYELPVNSSILIEYEMTMPETEGVAGAIAAVKYMEGSSEKTPLQSTPAYVIKGEKVGTIEIQKTYENVEEGEVPEGITSFAGVEFYLVNVETDEVLVTPQTNSEGIFATNEEGKIILTNVPSGDYELIEVTDLSAYGYGKINQTIISVSAGLTTEINAENPLLRGKLTILKQWEDTDEQQGDVRFSIYRKTGETEVFVARVTKQKTEEEVVLYQMPYGTYIIKESTPYPGWYAEDVEVVVNQPETEVTVLNKIGIGNIEIIKTVPSENTVIGLTFDIKGIGYTKYINEEGILVGKDFNDKIKILTIAEYEALAAQENSTITVETLEDNSTVITGLGVEGNVTIKILEDEKTAILTISEVPLGSYVIEEVEIPTIKEINEETEEIIDTGVEMFQPVKLSRSLSVQGATISINISNSWKQGYMEIQKTATGDSYGAPLNQQVRITGRSMYGTTVDKIVNLNADGYAKVPVYIGEYTVEEVDTDVYLAWYTDENGLEYITPQKHSIEFNKTTTVKIRNEVLDGYIKITKTLEGQTDVSKAEGIQFKIIGTTITGRYLDYEDVENNPSNENYINNIITIGADGTGISGPIPAGGEYVLIEVEETVPEFYVSADQENINITKNNTLEEPLEIEVENERGKGNLEIVTETNPEGGPLTGITYKVTEVLLKEDGTYETIGEPKAVEGSNLPQDASYVELKEIYAGNYIVEHETVPEGWLKDVKHIIEVPISGIGYAVLEITEEIGSIDTTVKISKEILNSNNEIATDEDFENANLNSEEGFEVKITDVETKEEYYTFMNTTKPAIIKGLTEGTYEVEEVYKPKYITQGYYLITQEEIELEETDGKYVFTIGEKENNENEVEIKIVNKIDETFGFGGQDTRENLSKITTEQADTTSINRAIIYVTDEENEAVVGAVFKIYDNQGKEVVLGTPNNTLTTSSKKIVIKGLPAATYTVKCISVPEGYLAPQDKQITVYEDAVRVIRIELLDATVPRGNLRLETVYENNFGTEMNVTRSAYKIVDAETGDLLTFKKQDDGTYIRSNSVDAVNKIPVRAFAMIVRGIEAGTYEVGVVELPDGFGLSKTEPETVTIISDATEDVKVLVNRKKIVQIEAGYYNSIILDENGDMWIWGNNQNGEYGNGESSLYNAIATKIEIPAKIKQFSGTRGSSSIMAAIDNEGNIWTWGENYYGQLGNGTTVDNYIPECISDIPENPLYLQKQENPDFEIVEIRTGNGHVIALDNKGKIWTWGYNYYGQLGNGTSVNSNVPICISTIEGNPIAEAYKNGIKISKIAKKMKYNSAVIDELGRLWTWGYNYNGQLGDGTSVNSNVPICISDEPTEALFGIKVQEVDVSDFTIILDNEGNIWTWGYNSRGQLGDGTTTNRTIPQKLQFSVFGNKKIIDIDNMNSSVAVIDEDGKVWTWGYNDRGQLGNGTSSYTAINSNPICISDEPTENLYSIKSTQITGSEYAGVVLMLDNNGAMWGWGNNNYSQLGPTIGYGTLGDEYEKVPNRIDIQYNGYLEYNIKFVKIAFIESGGVRIVLDKQGQLWSWGNNTRLTGHGIQNYTTTSSPKKVPIPGDAKIIDIKTGNEYAIALDDTGRVWTWGRNPNTLGIENVNEAFSPVEITEGFGTSKIIQIDAGSSSGIALGEDGKVWTWGNNGSGQLGNGTTSNSNIPICISDNPNEKLFGIKIKSISSAYSSSYAIDENGKLWSWGSKYDIGVSSEYMALNLPASNQLEPLCITDIEGSPLNIAYQSGNILEKLECDNNTVMVLDNYGKVWTFGGGTTAGTSNSYEPICLNNIEENPLKMYQDTQDEDYKIIDVLGVKDSYNNPIKGIKGYIIDNKGNVWYVTNSTIGLINDMEFFSTTLGNRIIISADDNGIIDEDGRLWTWGSNLGNGISESSDVPICLFEPTQNKLYDIKIEEIISDELVISEDGKVYYINGGSVSELMDSEKALERQGVTIKENGLHREIYGNTLSYVAIDKDGKVWTWGLNNYGELGNGTTTTTTSPQCISDIEGTELYEAYQTNENFEITSIEFNENSVLALDNQGKVWSWGYNNNGKLGNGTSTNITKPICISNLEANTDLYTAYESDPNFKITTIQNNSGWSRAIDSNGNTWNWGYSGYFKRYGETNSFILRPVKDIGTGSNTKKSFVLSPNVVTLYENGNIYSTGMSTSNNALYPSTSCNIAGQNIIDFEVFNQKTARYSTVYAWGENKLYAWGSNGTSIITTPKLISQEFTVKQAIDINARSRSYFISTDNELYMHTRATSTVFQTPVKIELEDVLVEEFVESKISNTIMFKDTLGNLYIINPNNTINAKIAIDITEQIETVTAQIFGQDQVTAENKEKVYNGYLKEYIVGNEKLWSVTSSLSGSTFILSVANIGEFTNVNIVQIEKGKALDDEGNLYVWGSNPGLYKPFEGVICTTKEQYDTPASFTDGWSIIKGQY